MRDPFAEATRDLPFDTRALLVWLLARVQLRRRGRRSRSLTALPFTTAEVASLLGPDAPSDRRHPSWHRAARMIRQLEAAGLVDWYPGAGGRDGTIEVTAYRALVADGRRELGSGYCELLIDRLDDLRDRVGFDAWAAATLATLATEWPSCPVEELTGRALAGRLGMTWPRLRNLSEVLVDADLAEVDLGNVRGSVPATIIAAGAYRFLVRLTRPMPRARRFSPSSEPSTAPLSDSLEQVGARLSATGARPSATDARLSATGARSSATAPAVSPTTFDLDTSLPSARERTRDDDPVEEEAAPQPTPKTAPRVLDDTAAREVLLLIAGRVPTLATPLRAAATAPRPSTGGRDALTAISAPLARGWTPAEVGARIVDGITAPDTVRSPFGLVISLVGKLHDEEPPAMLRARQKVAEAEQRAAIDAQRRAGSDAQHHARRRREDLAHLEDLAPDAYERLRQRVEAELTAEHGCRPIRPYVEARMHDLAGLGNLVDLPMAATG